MWYLAALYIYSFFSNLKVLPIILHLCSINSYSLFTTNLVYKCDFDNPNFYCNGYITQDPSGSSLADAKFQNTKSVLVLNSITSSGTTITITDVTSISN